MAVNHGEPDPRSARRHNETPPTYRSEAQRDRDRALYSPEFRRLDSVTQVISPAHGSIVHNRLTHTLEVAQIGRRLAEKLAYDEQMARRAGGINPDVVEAAALIHDLGHPPFGHVAEDELDGLVRRAGILDGFNGNAQSFRIVTTLSIRDDKIQGLNLTRATLDAVLKYPWFRQTSGLRAEKWGAYHTEREDFAWARELHGQGDDNKSIEAEIMDWADDVAYSVHDVEDFYRAGLIPIDRFVTSWTAGSDEATRFLDAAQESPRIKGLPMDTARTVLEDTLTRALEIFPSVEPYDDTLVNRAGLSIWKSQAIGRYIDALRLADPVANAGKRVKIDPDLRLQVALLKELTWYYVIDNPDMANQRYGQRRIIKMLFKAYQRSLNWDDSVFPKRYREFLHRVRELGQDSQENLIRLVADLIASMTEREAIDVYGRLTGANMSSIPLR